MPAVFSLSTLARRGCIINGRARFLACVPPFGGRRRRGGSNEGGGESLCGRLTVRALALHWCLGGGDSHGFSERSRKRSRPTRSRGCQICIRKRRGASQTHIGCSHRALRKRPQKACTIGPTLITVLTAARLDARSRLGRSSPQLRLQSPRQ